MGFIKHGKEARESIGERRERYLGHTDKLMMVVIDFNDGPTSEPDPPHSHPHEQMSYVVTGELVYISGTNKKSSVRETCSLYHRTCLTPCSS